MDYDVLLGMQKVLMILSTLVSATVALVAAGVGVYCTMKKLRPAAAWIVAVSWGLMFLVMCLYLLFDLVLSRTVGWDVMGWLYLLMDMFSLVVGLIMGVGYFLFKPVEPAVATAEVTHE